MMECNDDTGKLVNPVVYILWTVSKELVVYIIIIHLCTIIKYVYYSIILYFLKRLLD